MKVLKIEIVTSTISAVSILTGSILGAICTWYINKRIYSIQINDAAKIRKENRMIGDGYRAKDICNKANILRIDIATAIFQSIRVLKNRDENKRYLYLLPVCKDYSTTISSLSDRYTLQELSIIYQLYGIIEKVNRDINNWKVGDNEEYEKVKIGLTSILMKIYGEDYKNIIMVDPEKIAYEDLYKNEFITPEFKDILTKLDNLCVLKNLMK